MTDADLRLSDAERDAAAADLGEHFAQGRLTADEHAERLDRIWAARTRGELPPIFGDLPSSYAARPTTPTAARERHDWAGGMRPFRGRVPAPLLVVLAAVIVVSVVTHLPFVLLGLAVLWFGVLRHRGWRAAGHRRW